MPYLSSCALGNGGQLRASNLRRRSPLASSEHVNRPSGVCRDKTLSFLRRKAARVFRAFAHYASARARLASRTSS
ncbi:TPA_asm: MC006.1R [Molluscum contagiosum virus]|uniref:MC006.1R n=2 Tax=Molluscum contagiosum virus TaxID=10279 RepID=A0A7G5AX06_MCV1|nr:MC006.1 [Molluscum contagiosum virus subtype 1]QHW16735.1 MC006.1R [Molluscum contagiosum virus]AQY16926.1 MC006.1 [Molluscum contagiosum virus subtype 1]AQY17105.1 MC006.1 [Molluscum contagiosum virus subtype 1]AYO87458.1 MC006.1 [Molluscum contagiosum virus subtype 1]